MMNQNYDGYYNTNNNSLLNNSTGSYYDSSYYNNNINNYNYWYPNDTSTSSIYMNGSPITNRGSLCNNQYVQNYSNNDVYYNQPTTSAHYNNYQSSPISLNENKTNGSTNIDFNSEILPLIDAITNGCSKRRMRTAFTQDQRKYLLEIFEKYVYPGKDLLEELAAKMNVTTTIIQVSYKIFLVFN